MEERATLLMMLWTNQGVASFYAANKVAPPVAPTSAARAQVQQKYTDYFEGRAIKMNTGSDVWDAFLYNRDVPRGGKTGEQIYEDARRKFGKRKIDN